jgi:hypothetical protein
VFAVAVLPHVLAVTLPFQLDDYAILPNLLVFVDTGALPPIDAYFYRPTAWALWSALLWVGGGIAHAPLFHAVVLASHGLAAWLLFRVLAPAAGRRAAFAAAVAFGVMPGGIQAVTWIAAAGDQLALVLLLAGVLLAQRFARTGARWTTPAISVAAFASFLAKESVVALAPAAALGLLSVPRSERRDRRWWIPAAAAAAGLAAGIVARWIRLGTPGPSYAYDVSLTASELARVHKPLFQMLAPWNRAPELEDLEPTIPPWIADCFAEVGAGGALGLSEPVRVLWISVILTLGVPILLGLIRDPRRIPRAILLGAAFLAAFLPCVAAWRFDFPATNTLSRTFYGPLAVFCALLAACLEPLFRPSGGVTRRLRGVAVACLLGFLVITVDLLVHVWRVELRVAGRIRSRLESLEAAARAEAPGTHLLAVDPDAGLAGMPLIGPGVASALSRPFSRLGAKVSWWHDAVTLDRCAAFRKEPGPIRVLEVSDHRFVPLGELVPAMPATPPRLAPVPGRPGRFEFPEPTAARAIAAIRIPIGARRDDETGPACTWEGESGAPPRPTSERGPLVLPKPDGAGVAIAVPPRTDDRGWRTMSRVRAIEVRGVDVAGEPEVVGALPEIELRLAMKGHLVVLGEIPRIPFRVPFDSSEYRVTFDFLVGPVRFPMVYTVDRARLERIAGREYVFVPARDDRVEWIGHGYQVTWHGLPDAFRRELSQSGLHQIAVQFRVEGVAGDGVTPESESAWGSLTILDDSAR